MSSLKKRGDVWYLYWYENGRKKGKALGTSKKREAQQRKIEMDAKNAKKKLGLPTDIDIEVLSKEYLKNSKATKKYKTWKSHDKPRLVFHRKTINFVRYLFMGN